MFLCYGFTNISSSEGAENTVNVLSNRYGLNQTWKIHYVILAAALQTLDYFTALMLFHKVTQSEGE